MIGHNCVTCRVWIPSFAWRCSGCGEMATQTDAPENRAASGSFVDWIRACLGLDPLNSQPRRRKA